MMSFWVNLEDIEAGFLWMVGGRPDFRESGGFFVGAIAGWWCSFLQAYFGLSFSFQD